MFKLKIETGNAAFEEPFKTEEVIRILKQIITELEQGQTEGHNRDINGNMVSEYVLT
jgi:hypothetical protein